MESALPRLPTSGLSYAAWCGLVKEEKVSGKILEETQVHFQKPLAMMSCVADAL